MKHPLLYSLLLLMALGLGCKKLNYTPPIAPPSGTFSGNFAYLHRHTGNAPYDTLKANISLNLKSTNGTFTVTGDTSTLHAGSLGTYGITAGYIKFADKTYPAVGIPAKIHLSGTYLLSYDGSNLKMLGYNADTVRFEYDLIKN